MLDDECSKIELGIMRLLSGNEAMPGCLARILASLPSEAHSYEPEHALQALTLLQACPAWKISPHAAHSLLGWTLSMVSNLVEEKVYQVVDSKHHAHAGAI